MREQRERKKKGTKPTKKTEKRQKMKKEELRRMGENVFVLFSEVLFSMWVLRFFLLNGFL